MLKKFISYLTLKPLDTPPWFDSVEGKCVYYYVDCYGDVYMKHCRYCLFSVKCEW